MVERAAKGCWVEIHSVVLAAGERAPHVPDDTKRVPLEMRVKGFLTGAAEVGETVEVVTVAGRRLKGTLDVINPAYDHGFGAPLAELLTIGPEIRAIMRGKDDR
jgi:hypothetical protein